jgi:hypothetical protein
MNAYKDTSEEMVTTSHFGKSNEHGPPIHLHHTIRLDPMLRSLIRENGGGKVRKRQGQLLAKTYEVVKTLTSTRMRATQRRRTTKKANRPRLKLQIVAVAAFSCSPPKAITSEP